MEHSYKVELTQTEAQAVLTALSELPIKVGLNTFQKILAQLQAQERPVEHPGTPQVAE